MSNKYRSMLLGVCACTVLLIGMLVPTTAFAAGLPGPQDPGEIIGEFQEEICVGDTIPSGMVLLDYASDPNQCNGGNFLTSGLNVEMVGPAPVVGHYLWVCPDSPLPPEDVIVAKGPDGTCGGVNEMITPASGPRVTICITSPIPSGYMPIALTQNIACTLDGPLGKNAVVIQPKPVQSPLAFSGR